MFFVCILLFDRYALFLNFIELNCFDFSKLILDQIKEILIRSIEKVKQNLKLEQKSGPKFDYLSPILE